MDICFYFILIIIFALYLIFFASYKIIFIFLLYIYNSMFLTNPFGNIIYNDIY